jgi:hypothetical protein
MCLFCSVAPALSEPADAVSRSNRITPSSNSRNVDNDSKHNVPESCPPPTALTDFNIPLSPSETTVANDNKMCAQAEPSSAPDSQPSTCTVEGSQIQGDDEINWDDPEYRTEEFRM